MCWALCTPVACTTTVGSLLSKWSWWWWSWGWWGLWWWSWWCWWSWTYSGRPTCKKRGFWLPGAGGSRSYGGDNHHIFMSLYLLVDIYGGDNHQTFLSLVLLFFTVSEFFQISILWRENHIWIAWSFWGTIHDKVTKVSAISMFSNKNLDLHHNVMWLSPLRLPTESYFVFHFSSQKNHQLQSSKYRF